MARSCHGALSSVAARRHATRFSAVSLMSHQNALASGNTPTQSGARLRRRLERTPFLALLLSCMFRVKRFRPKSGPELIYYDRQGHAVPGEARGDVEVTCFMREAIMYRSLDNVDGVVAPVISMPSETRPQARFDATFVAALY